jgi:uncharacterized protein YggE
VKPKAIALIIALAALAAILAAACGGGGGGASDEVANIRTDKGLSVAALVAGAGQQSDQTADQSGATPTVPEVSNSDAAAGVDRSSAISPEFAPYPYPSLQESQTGVTVEGYGSASADADSAVLELYFGGNVRGVEPVPAPDSGQSEPSSGAGVAASPPESDTLQQAQPITEADLQPVVDAIVAQGVSRDDVEVIVQPSYGDPYYGGSATIRVTVKNVDGLQGIVDAATNAASSLENISFQGSNVSYTVSDCASLELAAMQAAVQDARERGQTFASALGVGLGAVVGASHYSYSPYGAPCGSDAGGPYPLSALGGYAEGQSSQVELIATVAITFAIQ